MTMLDRPRLWRRLDEGMERALTLACAPAGYGKTALLRQWQERRDWPVAWAEVDARSTDAQQVALMLATALESLAGQGEGAQSRPPEPGTVPRDLMADALNAVAGLSGDVALVIDNHLPAAAPVAEVLAPVLDFLPPQLHLFIASRAMLDLGLGRLRMRGQVAELVGADLALTEEETAVLLASNGVACSPEQAADLQARSEGWVTGLRLLINGHGAPLASYLETEVFSPLPGGIQRFLLQTCGLETLSAPLCNAVTGRTDGQQMLEALERANLFIFPLDHDRREYRYHGLFARFLRSRAAG